MSRFTNYKGFTMIELVIVIIIAGILAAVAMRAVVKLAETAKTEETKQELEELEYAIVGNPRMFNDDTRADFGYTGDVGALPGNLDALFTNPGGYTTWKGPYVKRRFEQDANDYKQDAWGTDYAYTGGVTITSSGSGSDVVRKFGEATSDFVGNGVDGVVLDLIGTPPGATYNDSASVRLTVPNGSGSYTTMTTIPDNSGFFSFNSVPIGNHDLRIIYLPANDTLKRFVSVLPKSRHYGEYYLKNCYWSAPTSGSLTYVNGTASTTPGSNCDRVRFNVVNNSGCNITITNMTITWSSPTAYYQKIDFAGSVAVDKSNPRFASGQQANFTTSQTINGGQTVTVNIIWFSSTQTGGRVPVNVSNTNLTITFSDGSVITINSGTCS